MKTAFAFVALTAILAIPAHATAPIAADEAQQTIPLRDTSSAADLPSLALAREFVALLYPTAEKDWVEQFREAWTPSEALVGNASIRAGMKDEVDQAAARLSEIVDRRTPGLMEAYANAYAREYSSDELRDMIAFAATPTGRHFLHTMEFVEGDDTVAAARDAMSEEMAPVVEGLQTAMCQRATQIRIAAGETDAECGRV